MLWQFANELRNGIIQKSGNVWRFQLYVQGQRDSDIRQFLLMHAGDARYAAKESDRQLVFILLDFEIFLRAIFSEHRRFLVWERKRVAGVQA